LEQGEGAIKKRGYPMIVTVFRTRMNPDVQDEYGPMAKRMSELARAVPGYVSHKGFVADDGERLTIVEFETEEALQKWRVDLNIAWRKGVASKVSSASSSFRYAVSSGSVRGLPGPRSNAGAYLCSEARLVAG
jgi:heme-degrading monooxygenase HmoA